MANKKKYSRHNKSVKRTAEKYKSGGWSKIRADHTNKYKDPKTMNGRRADIVARKNGKVRVVEVETPKSMKRDRSQRKDLKRYTSKRPNVKYKTKKTGGKK